MLGKVAAERASTAVTWNQNTMVIIWAGAVDVEELYSYASTYDEFSEEAQNIWEDLKV